MIGDKMRNFKFKILNCKLSKSEGFTLIEVTVTILVFSIIAILISSIFVRAIELERRTVLAQRLQENATLVLESMAKELRVSGITGPDSANCTATTLTMSHPTACNESPCNVTYSLNAGNIQRQATFTSIVNSSEVEFTRFNFCITGSNFNDDQSPKVTILLSLRTKKGSPPLDVDLQTTVTSREIRTELQNP